MSADRIDALAKFQRDEDAPQRFVSDPNGKIAKAYGVGLDVGSQTVAKRVTFIIGRDGKVLQSISDWSPLSNVAKTYDWLKAHPQTS